MNINIEKLIMKALKEEIEKAAAELTIKLTEEFRVQLAQESVGITGGVAAKIIQHIGIDCTELNIKIPISNANSPNHLRNNF